MHALVALTLAHLKDIARRPSTLVLAAAGVALVLSLRWFSAFGLGFEVVQLVELGVYSIGLLGAVAALLFWLPREEDVGDAEGQFITRPVASWMLSTGAFAGRLMVICSLAAVWSVSILAALWWFKIEDPRLFSYRGASSPVAELASAAAPVAGQLLATAVLLALIQPLARSRRPILISIGVLALYVLGNSAAGLGVVSRVLPDLSRHDVTGVLWGTPGAGISISQVLHACAWCAVGIALDSGLVKARSVS